MASNDRDTGSAARKIALAVLFATTLAAPLGLAKTFTSFPEYEQLAQNASGTFYAEQSVSSSSGHAQVYAHGALGGRVESVARMGVVFVTNAGDTIQPYQSLLSTHGSLRGTISCVNFNGGTEGSINLDLQQWRLENAVWVLKDTEPVTSWSCPFVSIVLDNFAADRVFTFQPASTYRIMLQVLARATSADTSQATVDFCESGSVRCGVSPEYVQLQDLIVPNQAPFAHFQDDSFWYVDALSDGVTVTGRACDADGTTTTVTVRVVGSPGETTTAVNAICGNGSHHFTPLIPGFYPGVAEGGDNEGAKGQDVGECRVTIFPIDVIPQGFPDLGQFAPASSFAIDSLIAADESILANRVIVDGQTVLNTLGGVVPPLGSHVATITYDLGASQAAVSLDGTPRWSGLVVPEDDPAGWWDIRPLNG